MIEVEDNARQTHELSLAAICQFVFVAEAGGFMCANEEIAYRTYKKLIMYARVEDNHCRKCGSALEMLEYLISGWTVWTSVQYTNILYVR